MVSCSGRMMWSAVVLWLNAKCRFWSIGSQWARSHLNTFTYKLTQNANEEEVIQFFYKSPQSFSLEADGSLNFHGKSSLAIL